MANRWGNSDKLYFLGSKITADGDCSHEIKRRLLFGRKVMTNLDRILKSRDITLPTKVRVVKAMAFPVVMYGYESWTIKKPEHQRIDVVGEDSWESLGLQGDPTSQSYRKSVLNIHWKDWCWSWNSNTVATWCKELTLMLGKIEGGRKKGMTDEMVGWHHQLNGHEFGWILGVGDRQGSLVCCSPWDHKESDTTERLNWTDDTCVYTHTKFPCEHCLSCNSTSSNMLKIWWQM